MLQEAENWGLLNPDPKIPSFLRLQPIFPYFMRNRLYMPEQREVRSAVETAFREHYDQLGKMLYTLLNAKDPQERHVGQIITSLEYENLVTALNLALEAKVTILTLYMTLSVYLDIIKDQRRELELSQTVSSGLEVYSQDNLTGQLGVDIVSVIDIIATLQLAMKQYPKAKALYQKALAIWLENKSFDAKTIRDEIAIIYDKLGIVARGQRQWEQARDYYLRSLEIVITFDDPDHQRMVLQNLARLWKASDDANLPASVANILGYSVEETEKLLHEMLGEK